MPDPATYPAAQSPTQPLVRSAERPRQSARRHYLVKEIFGPTIQGEGAHAGRPCVFLRFAACNLACAWCDTDFAPDGARKMTAPAIARALREIDVHRSRVAVVTGGEPALQWDRALADALADAGFATHMETNGTRVLAAPVTWLTVSPKPQFHGPRDTLADLSADASEVKVVVDESVDLDVLVRYEQRYWTRERFVQPCMDERYEHHLARALDLVRRRPSWRLSVQLHKLVGVP